MDIDPAALLAALKAHNYLVIAIVVVGWLTRMTSDMSKFPVTIPKRWAPVVPIVLGQGYAALEAVAAGTVWKSAVLDGLTVSLFTMGLFDLVVKAIWQGSEPKWIAALALIFPQPKADATPAPARDPSSPTPPADPPAN